MVCNKQLVFTQLVELSDVRSELARKKNDGHYAPMALFKRSRAVAASDIASSLWCEQQVEYRHLHPYLSKSGEWVERAAQGRPVVQRTAVMMQGSSYHMKKGILDPCMIFAWYRVAELQENASRHGYHWLCWQK